MKTTLILFILFFANLSTKGQYLVNNRNIIDYKFLNKEIAPTFDSTFNTEEKRNNFRLLREYLDDREKQYSDLITYPIPFTDTTFYSQRIKELQNIIEKNKDKERIEIPTYLSLDNYGPFVPDTSLVREFSIIEITNLINTNKNKIDVIKTQIKQENTLKANINNIKNDVVNCRNQINETLAPEYKRQDFKKIICLNFTILIGALLLGFFLLVYIKSDNSLAKNLLSGNGLQFITLFVLIISVILFGILDILKGSELAAILSGISGYILGKGTQDGRIDNVIDMVKNEEIKVTNQDPNTLSSATAIP